MPKLFLRNTVTQKRYEIVQFHKEAGEVSIVGPSGTPFREKFDKDKLEGMNYVLEKEA